MNRIALGTRYARGGKRGISLGIFVLCLAAWWGGTGEGLAQQGLAWADRRIPMDAPYAEAIAGNAEIYLIASTSSGVPSFAWSRDGLRWQQGAVPANREGRYEFITGVAFSGGRWVAVGAGGLALTSTNNARTWSRLPRVLDGSVNLLNITGVPGGFLAVGKRWVPDPDEGTIEQSGIFVSKDGGSSWVAAELEGTEDLHAAAVLGTNWVAVGNNGRIYRSTNSGTTWTASRLDGGGTLRSIAAGNGVFVVVGERGFVAVSENGGRTWETIFPSETDWVEGVAFGGGRFALSGGNDAQAGAVSADGRNWVRPVQSGAWGTLGYGPVGFLAVGGTYGHQSTVPNAPEILAASAPGTMPGSVGRPFFRAIASQPRGGTIVASSLPPGLALDPVSGRITGTPTQPGNFESFLYATSDGRAGSVYSVVFQINDPAEPGGEALVWRNFPSGLGNIGFQPSANVFGNGVFVAVGETWKGEPVTAYSSNGWDWSRGAVPAGTSKESAFGWLRTVVWAGGGTWLAGGVNSNLWRSTNNGRTWQKRPPPGGAESFDLQSLAVIGGTVLAVGKIPNVEGGEKAGGFLSRDQGATWQEVDFGTVPPLRSVFPSNGVWIASGERGILLRATNPAGPWEQVESGTLQTLRVVGGSPLVFLAWAEGGQMFRSTDAGRTWAPADAGSGYWPGTIANYQGLMVLSGGDRAAGSTSRDGRVWNVSAQAGAHGAVAAGPNGFVSLNGEEVWIAEGPWRPSVFPIPAPPTLLVGGQTNIQPEATGNPFTWFARGLPPGMTINSETGRISGAPLRSGRFLVRVLNRNTAGVSTSSNVEINVESPFLQSAGAYFAAIPAGSFPTMFAGGSVQLQVTTMGAYSGRLTIGTMVQPLRGNLDSTGRAVIFLETPAGNWTLELLLALGPPELGRLSGRLVRSGQFNVFSGRRNDWNAHSNPPTNWTGLYNVAFPVEGSDPGNPEKGVGFARLSVTATGIFRLAGRLSDNSPLVFAQAVFPNGHVPVHAPVRGGQGVFSGTMMIRTLPARPVEGSMVWNSYSPANFRSNLTVLGSLYQMPPRGFAIWNLPEQEGNAIFSDGTDQLPLTISSVNRVSFATGRGLLSCVLLTGPGMFRGVAEFTDGTGRAAFQGILLTAPHNIGLGFLPDGTSSLPAIIAPAE